MTSAYVRSHRESLGIGGLPMRRAVVNVLTVTAAGAVVIVRGLWETTGPTSGQHKFTPAPGQPAPLGYVDPWDTANYRSAETIAAQLGWRVCGQWTTLGRRPACVVTLRAGATPAGRLPGESPQFDQPGIMPAGPQ